MADLQKISGIAGQIVYDEPGKQKISGIAMQIVYASIPPGLSISGIAMQVVYEEGAGSSIPTQEQLMRHGTWFGDGVKKPFWWAK